MLRSSDSLNSFIHQLNISDIPDDVIHQARRCFVDLLGVWASGIQTTASMIARNHADKRYGATNNAVTMLFDGRKVSAPGAAFSGATTLDAIDAHDGHQVCKGHAGAALLPVLLAEFELQALDHWDELLVSLIVGYEVSIRCGLSLHSTVSDYHSSGAWNSIGCAAMGARLRQFDQEQTRHALGISEYYGPRAQMMRCIDHPTMVKDSSGWGAMVGVTAVDLAQDGFTGAPALLCESEETINYWNDLGDTWRMREMNFKAHPVCRWAQPAIEAALSVIDSHSLDINEIATVKVHTFHEATRLNLSRPKDCDEVQYCLTVPVAIAILNGIVLPSHIQPEYFNRPEVLALADRVVLCEKQTYNDSFPDERFADVEIMLADGNLYQSEACVAKGNFDNPLTDHELVEKFRLYAADVMPDDLVQSIADIIISPTILPDFKQLYDRLLVDSRERLS